LASIVVKKSENVVNDELVNGYQVVDLAVCNYERAWLDVFH